MCGQTGGETKTDRNTETKIDVWSDRRRNEDRQKHRDKDRCVVRQAEKQRQTETQRQR